MNKDELMLLIHKAFDERIAIEEEIEELSIEEQMIVYQRDLLDKKTIRLHKRHSEVLARLTELHEQLVKLNEEAQ